MNERVRHHGIGSPPPPSLSFSASSSSSSFSIRSDRGPSRDKNPDFWNFTEVFEILSGNKESTESDKKCDRFLSFPHHAGRPTAGLEAGPGHHFCCKVRNLPGLAMLSRYVTPFVYFSHCQAATESVMDQKYRDNPSTGFVYAVTGARQAVMVPCVHGASRWRMSWRTRPARHSP